MKKMNVKAIIIGILLIVTLIAVNIHGIAFAGDSLNSINPNYQGDRSYSSSSDSTDSQDDQPRSSSSDSSAQNQPVSPMGKAVCNAAGAYAGQVIGHALLPGIGRILFGTAGSNLCP